MKNCISTLASLIFGTLATAAAQASPVPAFNDPNLQECVDQHVMQNGWQTAEDIQYLDCENRGIFDITGIEQLSNLTRLNLAGNMILSIDTLNTTTGLTSLDVSGNYNIDINQLYTVISSNPGLTELGVGDIPIADLYSLPLYNAATGFPLDLTRLDISNTGIINLNGLEQFPNLRSLDISENELEFVDSLVYLTQLEELNLKRTGTDNVNFLAAQTQLKDLNLAGNGNLDSASLAQVLQTNPNLQVLDLSGLKLADMASLFSSAGLPNLTELHLADVGISGIGFLSLYPQLQVLDVADNEIADISVLSLLPSLRELDLNNNRIEDIAPLLNTTSLTTLRLSGNSGGIDINDLFTIIDANQGLARLGIGGLPIRDLDQLPAMFNYATGQAYPLVELDVSDTGIGNLSRLQTFPTLQYLDISSNNVSDITAISQLSNLTFLDASDNQISDITPADVLTRLTSLNLSGNASIDSTLLYNIIVNNPRLTELGVGDINIRDLYLLPLYNVNTGLPYNLTRLDISNTGVNGVYLLDQFPNLRYLNASDNDLEFVDGLQYLSRIEELNLRHTGLNNVDFLNGYTKLTNLNIAGNRNIDFAMLSGILQYNPNLQVLDLTGIRIFDPNLLMLSNSNTGQPMPITELHLAQTGIGDISFVSFYPQLRVLDLADNKVGDLTPLSTLTSLTQLDISNNPVSDLWPLLNLNSLTRLYISGDPSVNINDLFTIIDTNQGLTHLGLGGIPLGDLNQLPSMFNFATGRSYPLVELDISNTGISDLYRLQEFPTLKYLDISGNNIRDIAQIAQLLDLQSLDISNNHVADITSLSMLTHLTSLNLSGNSGIDPNDLNAIISNNQGLMELGLGDIAIDDFYTLPLYNPATYEPYNLTRLDISNTGITFLDVSQFANLRYLDISDNQLENLAGLQYLTQLEELNLERTPVNNVNELDNLTTLTQLNLADNKSIDFTTLLPILQNNPNLQSLDLTGIAISNTADLMLRNPLSGQPYSLTELRLGGTGISDIDFVSFYPDLKVLDLNNNSVRDISALTQIQNLVELDLSHNKIYDLTPLLGLTSLQTLRISSNDIININDLNNIIDTNKGLTRLGLGGIPIGDLFQLPPMVNDATGRHYPLKELDISNTGISSLARLHEFPTLEHLNISDNNIIDTIDVSQLSNLKSFNASNNYITDISSLDALTHLTSLDLSGNRGINPTQLSNVLSHNPDLTELGLGDIAIGSFDLLPIHDISQLTRLDISNTGTTYFDASYLAPNLRYLDISDNPFDNLWRLQDLTRLEELNLKRTQISDVQALTSYTKLTHLNLAGNKNIDFLDLLPILQNNPNLQSLDLTGITIADPNYLTLWNSNSGQPYSFIELHLADTGITDINFLSLYQSLKVLDIGDNNISNLSVLSELDNLAVLNASKNNISDISVLNTLQNLTELNVSDNHIQDLTPLLSQTMLKALNVSNNNISNLNDLLAVIDTNKRLARLGLGGISLEDLNQLPSLFDFETGRSYPLIELDVSNTDIKNISRVQDFPTLESLNISGNNISDISPISQLSGLQTLNASNNRISDVAPLNSLAYLTSLNLSGNSEIDFNQLYTIFVNNPQLVELGLGSITIDGSFWLPIPVSGQPFNLTRLDISNTGVTDVDIFPNLRYLDISGNQPLYLDGLQYLTQLEELDMAGVQVSNVDFLSGHTKLTHLNLANNRIIDFMSLVPVLASNPNLRSLNLSGIEISDPNLLVMLNPYNWRPYSFEELRLANTGLNDINFISSYPDLKVLDISSNYLTDVPTLGQLHALTELDISHNNIQDLAALQGLTTLSTLRLSGNRNVNINDLLSVIDANQGLTRLSLGDIPIGDLYQLPPMFSFDTGQSYQLIELDISNTGISDLSRLQEFPTLRQLDFSNNNITDVTVISQLPKLESLNATNNQVSNIASINTLTQLKTLDLSGNSGINVNQLYTVLSNNPELTELGLNDITIGDLNLLPLYNGQTGQPLGLVRLDISNTGIDNIDRVTEFAKLRQLDASQNNITNVGSLEMLALTEINLSNNQISDADFLAGQTTLTDLRLANNSGIILDELIPFLQENPDLHVLDLRGLNIDHSNLLVFLDSRTGLPFQLDELYLSNTNLSDLLVLDFYQNIQTLDISENPNIDLSTMPLLARLRNLSANGNALEYLDFLPNLPRLLQLDVSNNQVRDINPILSAAQLTYVNLLGNNEIPCPDLDLLAAQFASEALVLPTTCFNGAPPEISILSPTEGTPVTNIDSIMLEAVASDVEDGDLSANITWYSDIDGTLATGSGQTVVLSVGTHTVTATVTDSDGNSKSENIIVAVEQPHYCDAAGVSTTNDWIEQISIGAFPLVSGNNGGYANFVSDQPVPVMRGQSTVSVVPGGNNFFNRESWRIWIDLDRDGEFSTNEIVFSGRSTKYFSKVMSLPEDTTPGLTVMRVAMKNGLFPSECEVFAWGEVEDYRIEIQ